MDDEKHDAILPHEVVRQTMRLLQENDLPSKLEPAAARFVDRYLVPPLETGVVAAIRFAQQIPVELRETPATLVAWADIAFPNPPAFARKDWIGSSYPVFQAWRKLCIYRDRYPHQAPPRFIYRYFANLTSASAMASELVSSVYYRDVLAIRDLLTEGIHHLGLAADDVRSYEDWEVAVRDCVAATAEMDTIPITSDTGPTPPRFMEKCAQIADCLLGDRPLGTARDPDAVGRRKKDRTKVTRGRPRLLPPGESEDTVELYVCDSEPPEPAPGRTIVIAKRNADPGSTTPPDASLDPDPTSVTRLLGPATPGGWSSRQAHRARYSYRHQLNASECRAVVGLSDPARLALPIVAASLSQFLSGDPLVFASAWLSVSTGLAEKRVLGLKRAQESSVPTGETVHFIPASGSLRYRMIDRMDRKGVVTFSDDFFDLPLPTFMQELLSKPRAAAPLHALDDAFDKLSRRFSSRFPGRRPTLERLAASFWCLVAPHGIDTIDAAWIAGRKPHWLMAQPDYYRIDLIELTAAHQRALALFVDEICGSEHASPELRALLGDMQYPAAPARKIGSPLGDTLDHYTRGFQALGKVWQYHAEQAQGAFGSAQVPLLLDLLNLENLQLYLLQNLATGLRPVGEVGRLHINEDVAFLWKADKASAMYRERTAVPVAATLSAHHQQRLRNLNLLEERLARYGYRFEVRDADQAMALDLQLDTGRRTVTATVLTSARAMQLLHQYGLTRHFRLPAPNTHRHVMATLLHRRVAESHRDAYMTHNRSGLFPFGPNSTIRATSFCALRQSLDDILTSIGLERLDLKRVLKQYV